MRLLYFNPETEYALASGASFYTPPEPVCSLRHANRLLPEKWALPGDCILVDSLEGLLSPYRLVDWTMLRSLFEIYPDINIEPWGWNPAFCRKLLNFGVPESALPGREEMQRIRQFAHRRTTIRLNSQWNSLIDASARVVLPVELRSEDECMEFLRNNPGCWLKAPWSSSGRGVVNTAAGMTCRQILQWARGIIRRQGSVMAETPADSVADFATEWKMEDTEASFIGLSSFYTSNRGKYISNELKPQSVLERKFDSLSKIHLSEVVDMQKQVLESVLAGYAGPLGVDMIVCADKSLRPFVELNLRRTMGMLAL